MAAHSFQMAFRLAALASAILACGSALSTAEEKRMERTVTVSASGAVNAVPDIARIRVGVASDAATAKDALARNTAAMTKIVAGLKAREFEPKDIQTSAFTVEPIYAESRDGRPPAVTGYRVRNAVEVVARDLDRLGETLDALVGLGVNQVDSLSFEASQAETLRDEARKDAMANARRRAELLAAAGGAAVGDVLTISEDAGGEPPGKFFSTRAAAQAVPIERGTEQLEARVTVTWALK